jgi:DAHL domain
MKTLLKFVVFAALVAGLVPLYQETRGVDPSQREAITGMLRQLKELDTDWNVQVLRSKTGLNKHYDPVTQPERVALQLMDTIAPQLAAYDYRLKEPEQQLRDAVVAKIEVIDRFKAQNAVLRNSVRFIPLATNELKAKAREAGEAIPAKRAEMTALAGSADQVLIDTLKLETARDADSNRNLRQLVGTLVERRGEFPPAVAESFETFLNHVITISTQKEREEELLEELGKVPVLARIDALDRAFKAAFDRALEKREKYTLALWSYAGFLLALLAFFLGRSTRPAWQPEPAAA